LLSVDISIVTTTALVFWR